MHIVIGLVVGSALGLLIGTASVQLIKTPVSASLGTQASDPPVSSSTPSWNI